ncbi:MAG: hypothetical protein ABR536_05335 [Solirubrobacterales bacterium]
MTNRLRYLLLAAMACLAALGLVACGGGGGNDEDPQKVLDETFQSGKDYSKGVVDLSFKLAASGDQTGSLDASIKGPFQGDRGAFPQFDLTADVNLEGSGQNFGFQGGLASTADAAYVNFQGTDYQVDDATFNNFKQLFLSLQGQKSGQQASGLDPSSFLTDLSNEGTEDVDGTETIHISGKADVNKLVDQIKSAPAAANAPGAAQLDQLKSTIKSADFDVFTGADDKRLRKIDANLVFEPPADQTGGNSEKITIQFTFGFSDLGQPQTITAPSNPQPLSVLLQKYGINPNGLGGALGAAGAATGAGGTGATGGASTPSAPSPDQTNQYLQCLSQAKGQAATQDCASALQ